MSHSVALILHPKFPKDKDEGDNSSKEAALRINNLLQKEREFKFGSLCFKIVQTWTSATENEWYYLGSVFSLYINSYNLALDMLYGKGQKRSRAFLLMTAVTIA